MVNVRNMRKLPRGDRCHITTYAIWAWDSQALLIIIMLNEQIQKLMEVHEGMQRVRQIPPGILQGFQNRNSVWEEFAVLKSIGETVNGEGVQAALHRAQESMKADGGGLGTEVRRVSRKRRCVLQVIYSSS